MACRILYDPTHQVGDAACFYDSVNGVAFGPMFDSNEEAEAFLAYCHDELDQDPRALHRIHTLVEKHSTWFVKIWNPKQEKES